MAAHRKKPLPHCPSCGERIPRKVIESAGISTPRKPKVSHPHGTWQRYRRTANRGPGCRCVECKAAWAKYQKDMRDKKAQTPFSEIPHGLNGYTNYRCRCKDCKRAAKIADVQKDRREMQRKQTNGNFR